MAENSLRVHPKGYARIDSLGKTYAPEGKTVRALDGFSLEIEGGSFAAVVGKSGCGKTTLLKCVAGLEQPDRGKVIFRGGKIGIMFQDPRLFPWLTVKGNLALALPGKEKKSPLLDETLALVGLEGWGGAWPRQLSGGMAQRASLARCLCRKPDLLLLDEPLSALDSFTRTHLRKELEKIWRRLGLTVVLVTHDIEEAVYLGDRVILMDRGKVNREFNVPLRRPRDFRDGSFQKICAAIDSAAGNLP
ncbi:MAG: ABC transporter ATP-binding protein [Treponema sp.]|jgi:ABC-type nitrate/sulfonate/bicarbonate transport system ATPase subunit|nr:ABC transporter ATP-binding protein [Treponema sp.]